MKKEGEKDEPSAAGTRGAAIKTVGAFTGNRVKAGAHGVEGNESAGIRLGGPLTGQFTNDGTVSVLGDNALGIELQDVTGDVRLAGKVTAVGENAMAAQLAGDIHGALEVQGEYTATGYRYASAPDDPSKLAADDLLAGGPALSIEGDVDGGVIRSEDH